MHVAPALVGHSCISILLLRSLEMESSGSLFVTCNQDTLDIFWSEVLETGNDLGISGSLFGHGAVILTEARPRRLSPEFRRHIGAASRHR